MIENVPYYRNVPSGSWKNSIRFNLSSNACFSKVDKNMLAMRDFSGKGSLWCVNPTYRPLIMAAMTTSNNIKSSSSHSVVGKYAETLSRLDCLQDVREHPIVHHHHHQSQNQTKGSTSTRSSSSNSSSMRSRSASNLAYNSYPKPTINPRLVAGKMFSQMPTTAVVAANSIK